MDDLICKTHDRQKECLGGCSAHITNWYCVECDNDEQDEKVFQLIKTTLIPVNKPRFSYLADTIKLSEKQFIESIERLKKAKRIRGRGGRWWNADRQMFAGEKK